MDNVNIFLEVKPELSAALAQAGAVAAMALAALGSALGTGAAGAAALGAWKRCYVQKKPAPFQLAVFVGAPLSQTIYGFILMLLMRGQAEAMLAAGAEITLIARWPFYLIGGIVAGMAMGTSAWMQGRAGAGAADSFAETNEGFTNDLLVLGVIETVALFVMVFVLISL